MSQSTDTAAFLIVIPDPWANYSACSIGTFSRRRQAIIQRRQDPLELGEYGSLFVRICSTAATIVVPEKPAPESPRYS
jgi:hypothetical protein